MHILTRRVIEGTDMMCMPNWVDWENLPTNHLSELGLDNTETQEMMAHSEHGR